VQLAYDTYAAGIEVMQMRAFFGLGPWNYHIDLDYHTTGLVGVFYSGRQTDTARGAWQDGQATPLEFFGEGSARHARLLISYDHGLPQVKELQPPQGRARGCAGGATAPHSGHAERLASSCAGGARPRVRDRNSPYDGRRVLDVVAHTGGARA
jgi:hypothetical protein